MKLWARVWCLVFLTHSVFMSCGRLVHVGVTFNRFAEFGLCIAPKCVWQPGSARTRWGSYSAPPGSLSVIRGRGGREGEGKGLE